MIFKLQTDFDLSKTLECGQVFRYSRLKASSSAVEYILHAGQSEIVLAQDYTSGTLSISADHEEDWFRYLAAGETYDMATRVCLEHDRLKKAYLAGRGLRILHQDPWETLVSFIISQNNNIPRIKQCIEAVCSAAGTQHPSRYNSVGYFGFPSPEQIAKCERLTECGLGYRDVYVKTIGEAVYEGNLDPYSLTADKVTCEEAVAKLRQFPGIGPKVANCVALFGLGHMSAFPIDTWISKYQQRYFPDGFPKEIFNHEAGVIQQWMFYGGFN